MIVDAHTHVFPDRIAESAIEKLSCEGNVYPCTDGTVTALTASMKRSGIDRSIALPVATSPKQVMKLNDTAVRINGKTEETGVFSLGAMHPDFPAYKEELHRMKNMGLTGFKVHPYYQDACIDDIRYLRILDEAAGLGLVVVSHAGYDIGYPDQSNCSPDMFRNIAEKIGPFPLVLAHMGGWECWDEVLLKLSGTGVYLDASFCMVPYRPLSDSHQTDLRGNWLHPEKMVSGKPMLDPALFTEMVKAFGADHILFATDCPWSDQEQNLQMFRKLPLDREEQRLILGKNAEDLFKIS